ncbi:unnamed protein product [Aphanomyces euteiches]|uniref:Protein kinase domain-containing protein n=1 Tax=Aphanomyces euteiches TaxID=100861 RepID=A0A6G0W6F9_9STRA|nr:hypothetical protein Ae201684_018491 [Aphanomyces euteiches]KAH9140684.1 hypothetical protein AeRB84_015107 [Aphanomyces euteiches]
MPTFTCLADPEQGHGYGAFYSDSQGHLGCKAYIVTRFPSKWEDNCVFYKSASECEAAKNSLLPLTTNHAFYDLNQYTQGMKNLLNTIINATAKPTPAPSTTAKTSTLSPPPATPSSKAPSTSTPPASSSSAPKTPQPSSSNAPPAVSPTPSSPASTSSDNPTPSPSVVSPQTTTAGSTSVPSSTSSTTIAPSTTTERPTESPSANSTTDSPSYIDVSIPPSSQASTEWNCIAQGPVYTPVRINAESGQFECLATDTSDSDSDCYHLEDYSKCTIWLQEQETCLASNSCLQGVHVKIVQGVTATTTSSAYSTPSTTVGTTLDVPGSPGNSSSAPLVTIVLGVVCAALAIAAILGFVLWRRRQRQDEQFTPKNSPMLLMTEKGIVLKQMADLEDATAVVTLRASPMPSRSTISSQGASQPLDMGELSLWRLDNSKLTKTKVLSVGTTGTVSLGLYKGHQAVAIKQLLPHQSDEIAQGFIDEIKRMTKLESPYILAMVGCCWVRPREIELVTEYMENGDLRQFLDKTAPIHYSWKDKRSCIANLTQGLVYLHSMDIIHRDLKSRNVLLDAKLHAKLADFGVCREITMETMTCGLGSFRWTAPEILQGKRSSQAADIYALGMIVWELDSHQPPYATQQKALHITDVVVMSKITRGELSPEFTPSCPRHVVSFVHQCIAQDPDMRPTALDLASLLLEQESVSL